MDIRNSALPVVCMGLILFGSFVMLLTSGVLFLLGFSADAILRAFITLGVIVLVAVTICMAIDFVRCVLLPPSYRGRE